MMQIVATIVAGAKRLARLSEPAKAGSQPTGTPEATPVIDFPEETMATRFRDCQAPDWKTARSIAFEDYAAVVGRVLEVDNILINIDGETCEFYSERHKPFVVRAIETATASILHINDNFIDPFWNVEVIDGRGIVPDAYVSAGYPWVDGRSIEIVDDISHTDKDEPADAPRLQTGP
jgi:hypothetical protein